MAAAAWGGCLPLIVGALDTAFAPVPNFAFLPYTESIDYCKVGFIVPLINGRKVPLVPEMLDALESITASEWHARRSVAEGHRDVFRFRTTAPSAAEYIIANMCRMAAQAGRPAEPTLLPGAVGGGARGPVQGKRRLKCAHHATSRGATTPLFQSCIAIGF